MSKEIIICFIIIILVISFNILTTNFTQNTTKSINEKLEDLKEKLSEDDVQKEEVKTANNEIIDEWQEKYEVLAYYIEHDELEKVGTELTALKSSIDVELYEDGIENLDRCIFILNHIKDKYGLKVKNIF